MPASSNDQQLLFELTPRIQKACKQCLSTLPKASSSAVRKRIERAVQTKISAEENSTISLKDITVVSQSLRASGNVCWAHELLHGSRIHIDKPKTTPRNPELDARLDRIRRQLEEQEYQRMIAGVSAKNEKSASSLRLPAVPGVRTEQENGLGNNIGKDLKQVNQQLSVIINILFSALGVGVAVTYASYTLTSYIGYRILFGLGAAIVVVFAETWLFVFSGTRGQKKRRLKK